MPSLRRTPSPDFKEEVLQEDLKLAGRAARALWFADGSHDARAAVVCIAGMGANGRSFARQHALGDRWSFHLLNTPTETPVTDSPLQLAADAVEGFIERRRLERPVVLGSSFGSAVAALVALRGRTPLGGLVLVSPVLSGKQIPLAFPGFVNFLEAPESVARLVAPVAVQIMGGFKLDPDARDEIVREARIFSGRELKRRLVELMHLDLFPALPELRLPSLVVHGSRDLLVPWRRGEWVAKTIPGARWHLIRGAGHLPYLSHPDEFNAALKEFLEGLNRPRSEAR